MALGIEKLKACLTSVKDLVDTVGVVMADGKVSFGDITEVPALFGELSTLATSAAAAVEEVKDLDMAEAKELLAQVLDLISQLASKFKPTV